MHWRLRAAAETRRRACGGGPTRCTCDRSACRACVPSRSRAAATGHGAASDAAAAFRRTFATGGTPLRRAATELPASNCDVTASCHRLAPESAHRRIAAPKRTARRERAFAAAGADRAAGASARSADLAAPASHAATRAARAPEPAPPCARRVRGLAGPGFLALRLCRYLRLHVLAPSL